MKRKESRRTASATRLRYIVFIIIIVVFQLSELQDEVKRKESRWTASATRLRNRVEQLEMENDELRDELKIMEKRRLEAWQKEQSKKIKGIVC